MKMTLTSPRSRPQHLTTISGPEGCDAQVLRFTAENGISILGERDSSSGSYHLWLPSLVGGQVINFDVDEEKEEKPASGIAHMIGEDQVEVSLCGSPFMTFRYGSAYPKPVINPILTPGGTNLLREPMEAYAEGEHPWQRGLTLMQGAINGVGCWNEQERDGFGHTIQDRIEIQQGPLSFTIASENTWYAGDRPLMTDQRYYRLFDTPRDAVVLDVGFTLQATHGAITIGDTKEGGFLCIRINPSMNASADGQMRNAYGATDEVGCWSNPSHWMDYFGPVGDEVGGFAIFDHPENFRYPTTWHVRGYGLFAPNCWMFKPDHYLAENGSMTFRWRVVVHTNDTGEADIENRFLDYVDGPRAEWV